MPVHHAVRQLGIPVTQLCRRLLVEPVPDFLHSGPLSGQHAILQAIKTLSMDWWQKLASHETPDDTGREVVLADSVA